MQSIYTIVTSSDFEKYDGAKSYREVFWTEKGSRYTFNTNFIRIKTTRTDD